MDWMIWRTLKLYNVATLQCSYVDPVKTTNLQSCSYMDPVKTETLQSCSYVNPVKTEPLIIPLLPMFNKNKCNNNLRIGLPLTDRANFMAPDHIDGNSQVQKNFILHSCQKLIV